MFRHIWGHVSSIVAAYLRHAPDNLWEPFCNRLSGNFDLELDVSSVVARFILRRPRNVQLDADFILGVHWTVFSCQDEPASGDRIDFDVSRLLLFHRQLSGLGRHVQFWQSLLCITHAPIHSGAGCTVQLIFTVAGENVSGVDFHELGDCVVGAMEFRVHFPMGYAFSSSPWRNFVARHDAQPICRRARPFDTRIGNLFLASPGHDAHD